MDIIICVHEYFMINLILFLFMDSIPLAHNDNNIDREDMPDMKNRLFYDQLNTTVGDYLILNLSRSITGDCTKKYVLG